MLQPPSGPSYNKNVYRIGVPPFCDLARLADPAPLNAERPVVEDRRPCSGGDWLSLLRDRVGDRTARPSETEKAIPSGARLGLAEGGINAIYGVWADF